MKSPLFSGLKFAFDNASLEPKRLTELKDIVRHYAIVQLGGGAAEVSGFLTGGSLPRTQTCTLLIPRAHPIRLGRVETGRLLDRNDYRLLSHQSNGKSPSKRSHCASTASLIPSASLHHPPPILGDYQNFPFECQRRTPLNSPNDDLIDQLAIIEEHRYLTGAERSAYSYHKAIAALRAYPCRVRSAQEAAALSGIGPKTATLVEEFLEKGVIGEAQTAQVDERVHHLRDLCRVHGIGPRTAASLLDRQGIRCVAQLREAVKAGRASELKLRADQLIGLRYVEDFEQKLSRATLEAIADTIRAILKQDTSLPDCRVEIVGGYRRGKTENGDADILVGQSLGPDAITPSEFLLERLIVALRAKGLVTDLLQALPGATSHPKKRARMSTNQLGRCLCVYRMPGSGQHVRLDLVVAAPGQWAFALLGWTGSQHYERSIRLWAERKCGLLLSSQGLEDKTRGTLLQATSEEEIFCLLGLPFIEPEYRNC